MKSSENTVLAIFVRGTKYKIRIFEKNADFHGVQHFFSQSRRRRPGPGQAPGGPMQAPKFFKIIFPPPKPHSKKIFQKCSRKPQKNRWKNFPGFLGDLGEKPEPAPAPGEINVIS